MNVLKLLQVGISIDGNMRAANAQSLIPYAGMNKEDLLRFVYSKQTKTGKQFAKPLKLEPRAECTSQIFNQMLEVQHHS